MQQEEIVKQPEHYFVTITAVLWDIVLEQSTPSYTGESGAPPENFENQGAWKFIPVHFIAFLTDFVEGDDTLFDQGQCKIVFKMLASDVLPIRDLFLSGASNKSNEYMGTYNLSEKTGWGDH